MAVLDVYNLFDLDECVLNALDLFSRLGLPNLYLGDYERPLVVGSGNAAVTGRILFEDKDAVFADESTYLKRLEAVKGIDGAILISASGGKHAPGIAKELRQRNLETRLLTCNEHAPAGEFVDSDKVFVFPKNSEPYTYNTSTYMGMILAKTREDPKQIKEHLTRVVDPLLVPHFGQFDSFYFIVPDRFDNVREMFLTKFDELFQPRVSARAFTVEQSRHAKTVVKSDTELFVGIGYDNEKWGAKRLNIPLPENAEHGSVMAVGYYIIGKIQKQNTPWFKKGISEYCERASKLFNERINPIDF